RFKMLKVSDVEVSHSPSKVQFQLGLSCVGKFRCGLSSKCIPSSAQCDGKFQCDNGEDELGCGETQTQQHINKHNNTQTHNTQMQQSIFGFISEFVSDVESNFLLLSSMSLHKSQCNSGKVTTLKCLECGSRPRFTTRIVGGNLSRPGQFPWQVSLHIGGEHLCGGSIITSRWIVTAAHCMEGFADPSIWGVHVGLTELPAHLAQSLSVEQILYHAKYRRSKLDYDIALIKLKTPLVFNGLIQPICLPNHGEQFEEGTMCWISGWGSTDDGGESSIVLRSAMVPLLSTKTCSQPDVYPGLISPWMICAGYLGGGIDSCQGDSGGPLACEDSSTWKLVGATSWGIGCGDRNRPGVYTRITQSLNWIRQQMGVSTCYSHRVKAS
uniref:Transmembrane serine protease 3a n=1 Tax=Sphaeramia orbicularis TaxID=375764 RepID=A0A672ZDR8_9TELE